MAPLAIYAQAWRQARNRKGGDVAANYGFAIMCSELDRFNAEDREAGRAPMLDVLRQRYKLQGVTFEPRER